MFQGSLLPGWHFEAHVVVVVVLRAVIGTLVATILIIIRVV